MWTSYSLYRAGSKQYESGYKHRGRSQANSKQQLLKSKEPERTTVARYTTMAPTVLEYSSAVVSSLPDEGLAIGMYEKSKASEIVYGAIKDAISRHSATEKFGIRIIHHPFIEPPPQPNENSGRVVTPILKDSDRVVRAGNVTLVADITTLPQDVLERLVPVSWGFKGDGSIFPLEYALSDNPSKDKLTDSDLALVADIETILAGKAFGSILGLSLLAYQAVGVSSALGGGRVVLPFEFAEFIPGDTRHETAWAFGPGEGEVTVQGLVCSGGGGQAWQQVVPLGGGRVVVNNYPGAGPAGYPGYGPYPSY
ncbi:hypothetical protein Hypma_013527 [Hypsizygus marmoreus]|uniref:Uncharacterized protein n=1 Tax=Hypsizygus marmoreus TaxID=39966 RepID=A0A369JC21_HYPMA|nr:hypothetical protein Hypma_013527 [Hypsizygus marmoreus]